jgi:hypothetical protein
MIHLLGWPEVNSDVSILTALKSLGDEFIKSERSAELCAQVRRQVVTITPTTSQNNITGSKLFKPMPLSRLRPESDSGIIEFGERIEIHQYLISVNRCPKEPASSHGNRSRMSE